MDISTLFDATWYLQRNPDVAAAGVDPLVHYIEYGAHEGRDPCPLFDTRWYVARNPDVDRDCVNPLHHYLAARPGSGLDDPHPLFDTRCYLEQNPDARRLGINPLVHYRESAPAATRYPHPLFDAQWYLDKNPDVAANDINPLEHFVTFGAAQCRDPNPLFDIDWYQMQYPDIASSGANSLVHYILQGAAEGRDPSLRFDTDWYLNRNPDVVRTGANPLAHFIHQGQAAGREPYQTHRRTASIAAVERCFAGLATCDAELAELGVRIDVRMLGGAAGQAHGRYYAAWQELFTSLTKPYSRMLFIAGEPTGDISQLLDRALQAGGETTLVVATDHQVLAELCPGHRVDVRTLSRIDPQLSAADRTRIVNMLIYYAQPEAVLNLDSRAQWDAWAQQGGALSTVSRMYAVAPKPEPDDMTTLRQRAQPFLTRVLPRPLESFTAALAEHPAFVNRS